MPTAPTPSTPTSRASRSHRDALANLAIALGGVWTGVTAISLLSPDMVSGSEQQHLPIAAFTSWIWGTIASGTVVAFWARSHRRAGGEGMQRPMACVVAAIWWAAAAVAVLTPEMVTGSDPTRIPVAAVLAPLAAAVLTVVARASMDYVAHLLDDQAQPACLTRITRPAGVLD